MAVPRPLFIPVLPECGGSTGQKYKWPVVRLQPAFDAALKIAPAHYWCWDGVHPTYAGHAVIAREWLKVVAALGAFSL